MTQIIATFKLNRLPDDMHGEDIKGILMEIGESNNMDLVSWGTI